MSASRQQLLERLTPRQRLAWDAVGADPGLTLAQAGAVSGLGDAGEQVRALERRGLIRSFPGEQGPFLYPTDDHLSWPRPTGRAPDPPAERAGFRHQAHGDLRLVLPKATKQSWRPEERPWRSMVVDDQRRIVSSGFPKFFTAGEDGRTDAALKRALGRREPLTITEKLDGSLVIRSVHQGQVILRTRGTFDGGPSIGDAVRALCAARYPSLLDPALAAGCSVLLEFCSPAHRIVLPQHEDSLTLVGAVDHGWPPRLAGDADLERISSSLGVPVVTVHTELPGDLRGLRAEVGSWRDQEGVVVRLEGGQMLVKLKSDDYRRRHAARFSDDPVAALALVSDRDLRSADELVAHLIAEGLPRQAAEAAGAYWTNPRQ